MNIVSFSQSGSLFLLESSNYWKKECNQLHQTCRNCVRVCQAKRYVNSSVDITLVTGKQHDSHGFLALTCRTGSHRSHTAVKLLYCKNVNEGGYTDQHWYAFKDIEMAVSMIRTFNCVSLLIHIGTESPNTFWQCTFLQNKIFKKLNIYLLLPLYGY